MSLIPPIAQFSKQNNPYVREINGYTLSNLKTLLKTAVKNKFGVVAVNIRSKYVLEAALEAAWKEKSPLICEIAESESKYCNMPPERLSLLLQEGIRKRAGKYGYFVPIALHMDHVQKDLGIIEQAVKAGFSSAETDLSKLSLQENIKKCREVIEKFHPLGISIEVEEGEMGAAESLADPHIDANIEKYYTKVEDAYRLVEGTHPDALAIFVGNGHGKYLKKPRIGYNRIKEIAQKIKKFEVPIVLHGGSYLGIEVFHKCIKAGAAKFNYATVPSDILFQNLPEELIAEMDAKAKELQTARRKVLYLFEEKIDQVDPKIIEKAKQEIEDHLRMMIKEAFLSSGKAALYELEKPTRNPGRLEEIESSCASCAHRCF